MTISRHIHPAMVATAWRSTTGRSPGRAPGVWIFLQTFSLFRASARVTITRLLLASVRTSNELCTSTKPRIALGASQLLRMRSTRVCARRRTWSKCSALATRTDAELCTTFGSTPRAVRAMRRPFHHLLPMSHATKCAVLGTFWTVISVNPAPETLSALVAANSMTLGRAFHLHLAPAASPTSRINGSKIPTVLRGECPTGSCTRAPTRTTTPSSQP
mmetsp:Transcript_32883/g.75213  ORF Transcript_32883/g.75213 Transcript_32883/m.75213 type:complete len:217 (+) Transcript_32883:17-667(+)